MAKKLWKNIQWDDMESKGDFFKKYFGGSQWVESAKKNAVDSFRDDIKHFIENEKDISVSKIRKYLGG